MSIPEIVNFKSLFGALPKATKSQSLPEGAQCSTWVTLLVILVSTVLQLAGDRCCQDSIIFFKAMGLLLAQYVSRDFIWELEHEMGAS